jgi:hypothetical protein
VVVLAKIEMHAKVRVAGECSETVICGFSVEQDLVCLQLEEFLESFIFEPPLDPGRMVTKTFRTFAYVRNGGHCNLI